MSYKIKVCVFVMSLFMLFRIFVPSQKVSALSDISAKGAILIDADSGMIIYQKNAHERMGMASTTKIMTALTVVSLTDISKTVTVPREAVQIEGSSVYLCEGEQMTVEQLLYALLLASANDAAVALAITTCGSVEKFADQMNILGEELGLENTHFVNPHGLYDDSHYTTAHDLARISRKALENEVLSKIFATYKKELPFNNEPDKRLVVNHNKLLRTYEGAIGMKTGFTKKTGRCLVSAAERNGLRLICVTLNAPDDWRDHRVMLDYGFENYKKYVFANKGDFSFSMPTVGGEADGVELTNAQPLSITVHKGQENAVKYTVSSCYRFVYAPVNQGDIFGEITVEYNGFCVSSPLIASKTVNEQEQKSGFWQRLFKKD